MKRLANKECSRCHKSVTKLHGSDLCLRCHRRLVVTRAAAIIEAIREKDPASIHLIRNGRRIG